MSRAMMPARHDGGGDDAGRQFDVAGAACRGMDTNLFYPPERNGHPGTYVEARRACAGCPIRRECLAFALRTRQAFGMWGGTTPGQRLRMLRQAGSI